jgi:signal transduction histidine kinase
VIEVEDHGSGIPDDFIDRIFDPFFTTKSPDQGTGLGLAIVRDLVGSHGGELRVRSRQGAGACFVVELPVDQPAGIGADDPDSLQLSA